MRASRSGAASRRRRRRHSGRSTVASHRRVVRDRARAIGDKPASRHGRTRSSGPSRADDVRAKTRGAQIPHRTAPGCEQPRMPRAAAGAARQGDTNTSAEEQRDELAFEAIIEAARLIGASTAARQRGERGERFAPKWWRALDEHTIACGSPAGALAREWSLSSATPHAVAAGDPRRTARRTGLDQLIRSPAIAWQLLPRRAGLPARPGGHRTRRRRRRHRAATSRRG